MDKQGVSVLDEGDDGPPNGAADVVVGGPVSNNSTSDGQDGRVAAQPTFDLQSGDGMQADLFGVGPIQTHMAEYSGAPEQWAERVFCGPGRRPRAAPE